MSFQDMGRAAILLISYEASMVDVPLLKGVFSAENVVRFHLNELSCAERAFLERENTGWIP
jgi:hypothetical protein